MKTAAEVARLVLLGSGALLLVIGVVIWTGDGDQLIPLHERVGYLLVLSLWAIAASAARSGVSLRIVALAVAWGFVAPTLGLAQEFLVTGSWHWIIQVLHVLVSMGAIALGQRLVSLIGQKQATAGGVAMPASQR
jgi:hypothetical protein